MNLELERIERDDPTALKVFIAEYHFLKKDMEKAYALFSELINQPDLSPVMKKTVTDYLVFAGRELRKKEIKNLTFKISVEYDNGTTKSSAVITKDTFSDNLPLVGDLIELLDFYIKEQSKQQQEG